MKFALKNSYYKSPTPAVWRKIGDGLLGICSAIAIGGIFSYDTLKEIFTPSELKWMIGGAIALGSIGKFLTNFFKEDKKSE